MSSNEDIASAPCTEGSVLDYRTWSCDYGKVLLKVFEEV